MMRDARALVAALRDPASVAVLGPGEWTDLISIARAESLIGSLAQRVQSIALPQSMQLLLKDAIGAHDLARQQALWEAESARRALSDYPGKIILMKGTAYVAAGLTAGVGRSIGDLDIMVARNDLKIVEQSLLKAGWQWVKPDAYDDHYYREYMHELPPLIHAERNRMIDVHHTILPLTAGPTPAADEILSAAVRLDNGLYIMAPTDMVCHCAAHLFADGDLAGGLRNLWDFHCLLTEFQTQDQQFVGQLFQRAKLHQLADAVARALRLSGRLYGTQVKQGALTPSQSLLIKAQTTDILYRHRLLARDGYGREIRKLTRHAFYIRSHWLRMPPLQLARHLWVKWRKR